MIKPFNRMNIDASCLGNHELEHDIEHGEELIKQTNCPWLMTNLLETDKDNRPIAGCEAFTIIEKQGFKIGCLGFAEEQWLECLCPSIDISKLEY
jgi:2',3'-cyclic-nucleotide 2'-phosphodiesterase (5'-nucleotidase family)